jgi:hypothetical protein
MNMKFSTNLLGTVYIMLLFEFCLFTIIFPLENFRINLASTIFPAFEVILLYYFITYCQPSFLVVFLLGMFFDQLYSMPIGTNSLVFITANIILNFTSKFFLVKNYITNFIIFCFYYFFVLHFRYLLMLIKNLTSQGYLTILMQYFTTIFAYHLLRIPLDKSLEYLRKYAK